MTSPFVESKTEAEAFASGWGAVSIGDQVRFRLWAPGQERLSLRLGGTDIPMARDNEGWFSLVQPCVAAGTPYQFVLADGQAIADPASRAQRDGVDSPSLVTDPLSYRWRHADWRGRPWQESIIYELHVGTFTEEGTFSAAMGRLAALAELGITMIELMPVAAFPGCRGWGYDGVLLYAPHRPYGAPDEMKAFIDAAHGHGISVVLDVVYNHFGPQGNWLPTLAPAFFHPDRHTPWGAAIAYQEPPVRRFFIDNALYWLDEFQLDGLRLDAVDHITDPISQSEILVDIATIIRSRIQDRHVHITTEDNRNIVRLHPYEGNRPKLYTAEWNDDFHNAAHVVATGETEGYYRDFAEDALARLARALAEGFAYQGEASVFAGGTPRGVPSAGQPPLAFVDFLQNHDQIGNRAFGERLGTLAKPELVECLLATLLLSPHIPMLFMGEEWDETRPFYFFTDFEGRLADAVREGRRREFSAFAAYFGSSPSDIPDPNDPATFRRSEPDWDKRSQGRHADRLELVRRLIAVRKERIVPRLAQTGGHSGLILMAEDDVLAVDWALAGAVLALRANLGVGEKRGPPAAGEVIFCHRCAPAPDGLLPGCALRVTLAARG